MFRRIAVLGAVIAIVIATTIINLWVVKIISLQELKESLGKTLAMVGVSTVAALLIIALVRLGEKK